MNYLAHAYLSLQDPKILMGNMISDFVKGKEQFNFEPGVQAGIQLHRSIDRFTDAHPATKTANALLQPAAGRYAGAFVDIVYDHFLAKDASVFPTAPSLQTFSTNVYVQLEKQSASFPEKFATLFPFMQQQNWLYHYQFNWGVARSFEGLVRRAKYIEAATPVYWLFEQEYCQLEQLYQEFMPAVKAHVQQELNKLDRGTFVDVKRRA